jgi:hypothetical protein
MATHFAGRGWTMTAAGIVAALGGRRGRCACPSCRDAGRDRAGDHLAVSEDGGRVLLHCFAGCAQASVIQALRARRLWPERERAAWTQEQRRHFARAKESACVDALRAWRWSVGALERLNGEKVAAVDYGLNRFDVRALEMASQAARLVEGAPGATVLRAWRQAWERDPLQAEQDEMAGAEHERLGILLARAVAGLPAERGAPHAVPPV